MRCGAALLLALVLPGPAAASDGRAVFEGHCASCHAVAAGASPGAGPNLGGILGRRAAGDVAFGYSPVLEAAGREGRVWNAAMLDRFLADPEEMFPGTWMGANGLRAEPDRAAVVAYLGSPG